MPRGKQTPPCFAFFPNDFLNDTAGLSPGAKAAWITLLCHMHWAKPRGQLTLDVGGYQRLLGAESEAVTKLWIEELITRGVASHVTERNGDVTLLSRRMVREEARKKSGQMRTARWRRRVRDADVTLPFPIPIRKNTRREAGDTGDICQYQEGTLLCMLPAQPFDVYCKAHRALQRSRHRNQRNRTE